jgi:hypothetical protein
MALTLTHGACMPLFAEVVKKPNGAYAVDYPDGREDHCIDEYTAEEFAREYNDDLLSDYRIGGYEG